MQHARPQHPHVASGQLHAEPRGAGPPVGLLLLRTYFGTAILLFHGWPKLAELAAGGDGFVMLVAGLGLPAPHVLAWLAAATQVVGSALVVAGLWTRTAAAATAATIGFGVVAVHLRDGFFGMEVGLAYTTVLLALALAGPGSLSLDALRARRRRRHPAAAATAA